MYLKYPELLSGEVRILKSLGYDVPCIIAVDFQDVSTRSIIVCSIEVERDAEALRGVTWQLARKPWNKECTCVWVGGGNSS